MKALIRIILAILLGVILIGCSSVEERIKDHSYTDYWYWHQSERYQVYKTHTGRYYIIVLTKNQLNLKRKYIKLNQSENEQSKPTL